MLKVCCICERKGASYKCPTCKLSYCSVECCKTHKNGNCKPVEVRSNDIEGTKNNLQPEAMKYDFPTEDTVPLEKLQELKNSEEVKECLKNPNVRKIIEAVLNDKNPTNAIALAMTEPIFIELADACLKVVELPEEKRPC